MGSKSQAMLIIVILARKMLLGILMFLIGIVTTALTSVIHKNCEKSRKDTPVLLTLSVLIMIVSGGYLGYTLYNSTGIKSKFSFGG